MISVVIPTLDAERALVPTLAALVAGATAGLITEVLIADGGSHDETAKVADIAGCNFATIQGGLGDRLKAAAGQARASWLLFLRPGTVLETPWISEASRFVARPMSGSGAAVFRRNATTQSAWGELGRLLASALGARPRPEQGLLISKAFYDSLGGHSASAASPEADLIRRIGRRRIVTLGAGASAHYDT